MTRYTNYFNTPSARTLDRSRTSVRRRLHLLALTLACLVPLAAQAAKVQIERIIEPEAIAQLEPLDTIMVFEQSAPAIFLFDAHIGGVSANALAAQQSVLPSTAGSFAAGAAAGALGYLFAVSADRGARIRVAREAQGLLGELGEPDLSEIHEKWRIHLADVLRQTGFADSDISVIDTLDEDASRRIDACRESDRCLLATVVWGFDHDVKHLDAQLKLQAWSPQLRGTRKASGKKPDYSNLIYYRSKPMALPERKSEADRIALQRAAHNVFERHGIAELIALSKSSNPGEAGRARKKAVPLLKHIHQIERDAKASKWTDGAERIRRMQLWGENDAATVRETLEEALDQLGAMLLIETSADAQYAKVVEKFRFRDSTVVSKLMRDGDRRIAYVNDATLVSIPEGEFEPGRYSVLHVYRSDNDEFEDEDDDEDDDEE